MPADSTTFAPVRDTPSVPTLAVVICTRRPADELRSTLDSILNQKRPPHELILVDDAALDQSFLDEMSARCRQSGVMWRYFRKSIPGLTSSRNLAARNATADVLQFLDDDVFCEPGFLYEVADLMRDPAVAAVSANVIEPAWDNWPSRVYQLGYRIAGWWAVRPRGEARGRRPRVLAQGGRVQATMRLSGAAMAIRREQVLSNSFDESLRGYALGEDREMGYRLARRHWMLQADRARVEHRRRHGGRGDPHVFGFMSAYNYLYILRRTCRLGLGDWLLLGWTFLVLIAMHLVYAVVGDRRAHLLETVGILDGLVAAILNPPRHSPATPTCDQPERPVARPTTAVSRPRRVHALFITNRLEHGGAEWMLVSLARRLAAEGMDASVGCLKDAGPLASQCREHGVPVFDELLHFKTDFGAIARIADLARRESIDAIVAVGSGGDRMFWSALAGTCAKIPVIVWSHWCPTPAEQRFERANRALYRRVDRFIALGERHRRALAAIEYVPTGRIHVIHNGIELTRFDTRHRRAEARDVLGLASGDVGVAIVANLRREKRHDVFIAAAERVASRFHRAKFFVIGDGPNRPSVAAMASRSPLSPARLKLLGPRDDVPLLLAGLDVVCLCSELECFSLTLLEAAAADCACIGPDTGSLDEFLLDGRTGLVTRPADVDSLVQALDRLLSDEPLRKALAYAGRQFVHENFGIERTARHFAALLRQMTGGAVG